MPTVDGNAGRLGQVFLNLLINAAQAIPEGHADTKWIRVQTYANATSVIIEIADSGCGIPKDRLARIFDPFFTTKPVGVGTGLGLPICQSIVTEAGGEITVESTVGAGSVFRVALPIGAMRPTDRETPSSGFPQIGSRARILLVDDEAPVVAAVTRMLRGRYDVVGMSDASAALALLRGGEHFDVVVCDLMMPELGGIELYERIREIAPEMTDRIIFVTGGAFTARARDFLASVPNACLEKPFDRARIVQLIRSMVS